MDSKGNSTVVWILRIVYGSYTAFGMALACMTNHVTFGKADIYIYFYYVAIYALWLFFVTLLANMLAIRFGGMKGFGLVVIGICVCVALLSLWDNKRYFR